MSTAEDKPGSRPAPGGSRTLSPYAASLPTDQRAIYLSATEQAGRMLAHALADRSAESGPGAG